MACCYAWSQRVCGLAAGMSTWVRLVMRGVHSLDRTHHTRARLGTTAMRLFTRSTGCGQKAGVPLAPYPLHHTLRRTAACPFITHPIAGNPFLPPMELRSTP